MLYISLEKKKRRSLGGLDTTDKTSEEHDVDSKEEAVQQVKGEKILGSNDGKVARSHVHVHGKETKCGATPEGKNVDKQSNVEEE